VIVLTLVNEYYVIQAWEMLMFLLYGRYWWCFALYTRWWHYEIFVVVVRMYVHVLKHCTIVAPGTFRCMVWRNYVLNCLG